MAEESLHKASPDLFAKGRGALEQVDTLLKEKFSAIELVFLAVAVFIAIRLVSCSIK